MNSSTTPPGYQLLNHEELISKLSAVPQITAILGNDTTNWNVRELSGGNLNLVHAIDGTAGSVCVKQSLPYFRALGEGSPMPLDRIVFEHRAIREHARHMPNMLPQILYFDADLFLMVMEYLDGYTELRKLLMASKTCSSLGEQLGDYLARTMFLTSDLALSPSERRLQAASMAGNWGMFKWMEELSYTDPYTHRPRNSWNSPYLDDIASEFRRDGPLKRAVARLKEKYMADPAVLVHGDLHTDSILVGENSIRVIDMEHSFYGPFGYDFGHLLGHLFLNYFSQNKDATTSKKQTPYQTWLVDVIQNLWQHFVTEFTLLWNTSRTGGSYPVELFEGCGDLKSSTLALKTLVQRTLHNATGFTGIEMNRRILGWGTVPDFENIEDPYCRSITERQCLNFGRYLILNANRFQDIGDITRTAEAFLLGKHLTDRI